MEEQQRLARPPIEVVTISAQRRTGRWQLVFCTRPAGDTEWDRMTLGYLSTADLLEAVVTELQHRLRLE